MITSYKNKKEGGKKKLESSPNFLELDILPWCLFFTGTVELFIIPSPSYFKTDKGFGGGGCWNHTEFPDGSWDLFAHTQQKLNTAHAYRNTLEFNMCKHTQPSMFSFAINEILFTASRQHGLIVVSRCNLEAFTDGYLQRLYTCILFC